MSIEQRVKFIPKKITKFKKKGNPIKYVITGGPGTGKTTLINELKKMGHKIVVEAATFVITQALENGEENPYINPYTFQPKVTMKQIEHESMLNFKEEAFLDRSIIDGIAYSNFYNNPVPKKIIDYIQDKDNKYTTVFFLEPIDLYKENEIRLESKVMAEKLHSLTKKAYEDCGYKVISVPFLTVPERAKFVLKTIEALKQKEGKAKQT